MGSNEEMTALFGEGLVPPDMCDYSGHFWEDMGGGMEICVQCHAERETPSTDKESD